MRNIKDVLLFRTDISPFLVHLTRDRTGGLTAADTFRSILTANTLHCGSDALSDARFGINTTRMSNDEKRELFGAICFTETPLNEIHCFLEIDNRSVQLGQYGLVFLKSKLQSKGVSPVLYINNESSNKDQVFQALCSLIQNHRDEAKQILPLLSVFGKKITPPGARNQQIDDVDFLWEREWRYPSVLGDLTFATNDVFVGLCPDDEIDAFEGQYPSIDFIDPKVNPKWYAKKLIDARRRLRMKYSVV